ncbi:hypothetical protein HYC85_017147 [Camellia sinensis]|uniref:Neurobeachin beta-propeller domain-containing protein n=1 Tax=Camellia sinensis TaxID=4442 RepID=A0A7J7H1P3_CAMSI|nr:hypothetical protein HYC85_017147 [Camellia sinensis]
MGHEHKITAIVFTDEEQPLCISGDGGVGIYIWGITDPFGQEPIKKLFEHKDWRYTGIHALAISGTGYLYTGSGDKSIKAWSLQVMGLYSFCDHSGYTVILLLWNLKIEVLFNFYLGLLFVLYYEWA